MKKLLITFAMLICALPLFADRGDVRFEVSAPGAVAKGEQFRIEFSLNAKPDNFTSPSFDGLDVMAGPSEASSSQVTIINGNLTKSSSYVYTFIVQANQTGKCTVSGAVATVDGRTYKTRPVTIDVVDEGTAGGTQQGVSSGAQISAQPARKSIGKNDMFITLSVDKSNVYKGEPMRATLKLYTRIQMSGIESSKFPTFNGFWTQELKNDSYGWRSESYNGKVYNTHILQEYLLYPQQVGSLQIDSFDLTVIAQIVTQSTASQSVFDDFFGGADQVQEVRKKLVSNTVHVNVKPLPAGAPRSFTGAVGQFTMNSSLPSEQINANSSASFAVKVSGKGNLPLIQAPNIQLPSSFEQYNIKTTESLQSSAAGISGYRQFEYPFIARAEGQYTIPSFEFTYFNPQLSKYVTLTTGQTEIVVLPDSSATQSGGGIVSGLSKEDVKLLDHDIRFIKIGSASLSPRGKLFMWSPVYFVILVLMLMLFGFAYTILNRHIKNMSNATFVRGKRANKVALQRLRAADGYMRRGDQHGFYDEMLKALWGYMSDKLNIPVANLNKENIREELTKRGFPDEQAARFIEIISECEMSQYSPVTSSQMQELYADGVKLLSKIESLKKR